MFLVLNKIEQSITCLPESKSILGMIFYDLSYRLECLEGVRDASGRIRDRLVAVYQMYTVHESILLIAEMLNRDVHAPIAAEPM